MGNQPGAALDAWLRDGSLVLTSSDRATRALRASYHRRRRAEGLAAWPTPNIIDWKSFARSAWQERYADARLLLNPAQEQAIWSSIIQSDQNLATTLPPSIRRLAAMAMEAHDLLCSYAPRLLRDESRAAWDRDAGAFSRWLSDFNEQCRNNSLISASRVPLELISLLREQISDRQSLRLSGFDRLLPIQRELFDAFGSWHLFKLDSPNAQPQFHSIRDTQTELEACAFWCYQQLASNPELRLLVITQDQAQHRGEIERAFLRFSSPGRLPAFEFSLGIPLTQICAVRSALLLLNWLQGSLSETELDWLFSSGLAATAEESAALQSCMRTLRRHDLQRPQWSLESFLTQTPVASTLPREWQRRIIAAQRSLKEAARSQSPLDWAERVPHLLATVAWSGSLPQTSLDFQIQRRWTQALDTTASLGFDGRRISWRDFLTELQHAAEDILFAPQSSDAPIQIAGPAESAGLTADAIWFLGADEDSWPAVAATHPFLPLHVQREFGMPHASHLDDWQFAETITNRLLASASQVHFSFALQKDDVESHPSRLISQIVNQQPISADLLPPPHDPPMAVTIEDTSTPPFLEHHLRGGASVLSSQSQCPFRAFATARLAANSWDAAEAGLNAKQRGQILHDLLHSVWSGKRPGIKPAGIRSHDELPPPNKLAAFVQTHVRKVMDSGIPTHIREQMPPLYLELEEKRLINLISEWLEFERARLPFTVEATEARSTVIISDLTMNLRLDRVDRLRDGSQLVVDYKTGNVDPKSWDLPRPDDIQLPLYKLFGLVPLQPSLFDSFSGPPSGGLVFGRVRTGNMCFAGRVANARETLAPNLSGNSNLVKRRLTAVEESAWKDYIEHLVDDFIRGRADVDPRDYPRTCKYCGLQSVCRIQEPENRARFEQQESEVDSASEE